MLQEQKTPDDPSEHMWSHPPLSTAHDVAVYMQKQEWLMTQKQQRDSVL